MKKLAFAIAVAFAANPLSAAVALADEPIRTAASAPADEYFGAYQMSVLGIHNALHDLSADRSSADDGRVFRKTIAVEHAVADWRARYPRDSWLSHEGIRMALIFARLDVPGAAAEKVATCDWIAADYPGTDEASVAATLRDGVPDDADPTVPLDAQAAAPAPLAPPAPIAVAPAPPAAAPVPAAAPNTKNATAPIVFGAAVAAGALLLLRHH